MDSTLPDKSIKPSANADTPQNDTDDKLSIDSRNFNLKGKKRQLFISVHKTTKKVNESECY